ncbi:hypothetical protein BS47DRAFT_1403413 [Hydnum rufescens UP504]|uniref:Uncharacterized protein n=1 Tax=Hydnum rufescens UP504 TaxID=1448309 RepID=A0A9P6DLK5_9AGAM|nr:hypothetical protein BS47DRAFT_1403413 [Hydnum rufescens UP504]
MMNAAAVNWKTNPIIMNRKMNAVVANWKSDIIVMNGKMSSVPMNVKVNSIIMKVVIYGIIVNMSPSMSSVGGLDMKGSSLCVGRHFSDDGKGNTHYVWRHNAGSHSYSAGRDGKAGPSKYAEHAEPMGWAAMNIAGPSIYSQQAPSRKLPTAPHSMDPPAPPVVPTTMVP